MSSSGADQRYFNETDNLKTVELNRWIMDHLPISNDQRAEFLRLTNIYQMEEETKEETKEEVKEASK
jgi:hypothetical protein